jgi:hypothetical protein
MYFKREYRGPAWTNHLSYVRPQFFWIRNEFEIIF